jgi:hypothetical protein
MEIKTEPRRVEISTQELEAYFKHSESLKTTEEKVSLFDNLIRKFTDKNTLWTIRYEHKTSGHTLLLSIPAQESGAKLVMDEYFTSLGLTPSEWDISGFSHEREIIYTYTDGRE